MEELYLKMENKEVEGLKAEESDVLVDAITLGWVGGQAKGEGKKHSRKGGGKLSSADAEGRELEKQQDKQQVINRLNKVNQSNQYDYQLPIYASHNKTLKISSMMR